MTVNDGANLSTDDWDWGANLCFRPGAEQLRSSEIAMNPSDAAGLAPLVVKSPVTG